MFWVDVAERHPFHCCVTGSNEGPLIDTGNTLVGFDHRVYVGMAGVGVLARFAGWTSPGEREALDAEVARLEREVADLRAEVEEADRFEEAARYTLGRFDAKVHRKPGRKPRSSFEEAA